MIFRKCVRAWSLQQMRASPKDLVFTSENVGKSLCSFFLQQTKGAALCF